ncbi:hypothetical protein LMG1864_05983 [Achromobacter ruhlandii]|nr:hypothetical protein LMG1864_05983 [Achromobacter ruhlandii]
MGQKIPPPPPGQPVFSDEFPAGPVKEARPGCRTYRCHLAVAPAVAGRPRRHVYRFTGTCHAVPAHRYPPSFARPHGQRPARHRQARRRRGTRPRRRAVRGKARLDPRDPQRRGPGTRRQGTQGRLPDGHRRGPVAPGSGARPRRADQAAHRHAQEDADVPGRGRRQGHPARTAPTGRRTGAGRQRAQGQRRRPGRHRRRVWRGRSRGARRGRPGRAWRQRRRPGGLPGRHGQ